MTRSLFRRADGPSHSSYRKSVALKLAAFGLAVAVFLPLTSLLSRPKAMKDLSNGTLPFTFATRDKQLQKELAALCAARALPNQRAEAQAASSKRISTSLYDALSAVEFERMKTSCDQFEANLEAYAAGLAEPGAQASFQTTLDFVRRAQGQFDDAFAMRSMQTPLAQAFSAGESSLAPISLKDLADDNEASPLPDLQRILGAKLAVHLANGEQQAALRTIELMLKLANCALNSTEPDVFYLRDTLGRMARTLQAKCWSQDSIRELQAVIQRQRARPNAQKALLAYERERALANFEKVRQTGLRSLSGSAPEVNILADSLRELKPDGTVKAAKEVWNGIRYDVDADELDALKLLARLSGPGFMPYFKATGALSPRKGDLPISGRLKTTLQAELRKQSECLALLEAMDAGAKSRLGMEIDKSKASPLDGQPYRLLKAPGKLKIIYGSAESDAIVAADAN